MKHLKQALLLLTAILVITSTSCLKKEYDLKKDNLDLTIKVGGDELYLPIGSTDSIFLKKFINPDSIDLMELYEGGYALKMEDSFDFPVPEIDTNALKLDDISETLGKNVSFGDLSDISTIDGQTLPSESLPLPFATASESMPNINIPLIDETTDVYSKLCEVPTPPSIGQNYTIPVNFSASLNDEVDVSFGQTLPPQIEGIDSVIFSNGKLRVTVTPVLLSGVDLTIDTVLVEFPSNIKLGTDPHISGQTYLQTNIASTDPVVFEIPVTCLDFTQTEVENSYLEMVGDIRVFAKYTLSGEVEFDDFPINCANDPRLTVNIESDLDVESVVARVNALSENLPRTSVPFNMETTLDTAITSIHYIELDNAKITFHMDLPSISQDIHIEADNTDGVNIQFPKMFRFQDVANFDQSTNVYSIYGTIPPMIELFLDTILVPPTALSNGTITLNDSVVIYGRAGTKAGRMNTLEFNDLSSKNADIEVIISDFEIKAVSIGTISQSYEDSLEFDFASQEIPPEIAAIDSILLQNTQLSLALNLNKTSLGGKPLKIHARIELPEMIMFANGQGLQAGNILDEDILFENGVWEKNLTIKGLKFDNLQIQDGLNINEKIRYQVSLVLENPTVDLEELEEDLQMSVDIALSNIKFDKVYGKVDLQIEAVSESVSIANELPDMLKNDSIVLDVNPFLILSVATNLQIAAAADVVLIPYKNGAPIPNAKQEINLNLPKAPTTDMHTTTFFLAATETGKPAGSQYEYADLGKLIRYIPDSIQIEMIPSTDPSQQAVFDPRMAYKLEINYQLVAPLTFGPDLYFIYRDTIPNLDPIIGEMMNGNQVGLSGSILNSIPLNVEVLVTPIDSSARVIPVDPVKLVVKSGAVDGSAVESKLDVTFNDPNGRLIDLRGFLLEIVAKTDPSKPVYIPIRPENFIQIKLNAKVIGGVEIDLNDLGGKK